MRTFCCMIAVTLGGVLLSAQSPPPAAAAPAPVAPGQVPVFRAATRLVEISVVVHDNKGQPVTDLRKDDFTVSEKGQPQQIAFFSMTSATAPAGPTPALPPHIFTNVLAQRDGVPTGVTVILLDLLNTSWGDQHRARDALIKFLTQLEPQDRIAIFALGKRSLTLLHDYTTDASSLLARMKEVKANISSDLEASTLDADSQQELRDMNLGDLADANEREADFFTTNRVVNTLEAFQAIADHLSGLPGRKNIVWLSGGFPLTIGFDEIPEPGSTRDRRTFTTEMNDAVRALNNSGIAVYPVDARGLMVMPGFDASTRGSTRVGPPPPGRMAAIQGPIDAMKELAARTGGRAAYNGNDLTRAIRRAIDDARVTYTIGYYSTDPAQDGKFRDIKVGVDRPHLDVRYRKGYFAMRPADKTAQSRQQDIRAAVWSPLESTALAMSARVDFLEQPEPHTINVFLQLDPSTFSLKRDGDRWKGELDIVYVQRDDRGKLQGEGVTDHLTLNLSEANYATVLQHGFIQQRRLPRQAAATMLRIVARDVDSGTVGSVTVPFSRVPLDR